MVQNSLQGFWGLRSQGLITAESEVQGLFWIAMPSVLLCCPTTSEADVGGTAV